MQQNDHDLLITLHEQVKGIRSDIRDIKDNVKSQVDDHETRMRSVERKQYLLSGAAALLGVLAPYVWSLLNR